MNLNYGDLGARIKSIRLAQNMPQERLAELSELSTPHMSHVETGSTKVSLPTLIKITNALHVSMDKLLCDSLEKAKYAFENEIMLETKDCSEQEIRIIADTVKALKLSLRKRIDQASSL